MIVFILRILQAVLAIIVLGLTGYTISVTNQVYNDSSDPVNFLLFCGLWAIIALAYLYLMPMVLAKWHHPYAALAVEALTVLFWFAGWIALAVLVNGSCVSFYTNIERACQCAKAAVAMGCFSWVTWTVTLVFVVRAFRNHDNISSIV